MSEFVHSVTLDKSICHGCTRCVKRCPTEAIRVHDGVAHILTERCIDCGECIRQCPHHAKKANYDSPELLKNYDLTIALPAPALYGQFNHLEDTDLVLNALKAYGFDRVFEVSAAAELVSDATRHLMRAATEEMKPFISSACPAVVRLIRVRFPNLIDRVLPLIAPAELAARLAREKAVEETGLKPEESGIFAIVPCSSQVTTAHSPISLDEPVIDGAFAIRDLYLNLLDPMKELDKNSPRPPSWT